MAVEIAVETPLQDDVRALVAELNAALLELTPPEHCYHLTVEQMAGTDTTVFIARDAGLAVGCGALKQIEPRHGEIKSMRTSSAARGRGVGTRLLQHVVDESRQRGYRQLELETGTQEFFDPARRLYAKFGFVPCPPFGNYREDPNSAFFVLAL